MKNILIIVGSLRKNSFNTQLAREIARLLEGRARVQFLQFSDLPFLDQDIEAAPPEPVRRVRSQVWEANGVWICSPEYNHNIPGALKNLLDWLSRPMDPSDRKSPSALKGKPLTFSCAAGRSAAGYVRAKLAEFSEVVSMPLICGEGVGVSLDAEAFRSDILPLSDDTRRALEDQVDTFLAAI